MPVTRSTCSARRSCAPSTTHWTIPVWSRRSTKARCSPCSRRRATQPQTLDRPAGVRGPQARRSSRCGARRGRRRRPRANAHRDLVISPQTGRELRHAAPSPAVCASGAAQHPDGDDARRRDRPRRRCRPLVAPERSAAFSCAFIERASNARSTAKPAGRSSWLSSSAIACVGRVDDERVECPAEPQVAGGQHAVGVAGEQDPLDARPETDARDVRAAERRDQPVVAAAAADALERRPSRTRRSCACSSRGPGRGSRPARRRSPAGRVRRAPRRSA